MRDAVMLSMFIWLLLGIFVIIWAMNDKSSILISLVVVVMAIYVINQDLLTLFNTHDSYKELQQISYKYSNEPVCKNGILGLVKTEQSKSLYSRQNRDIVAYKKQEIDDNTYYNILYFIPISSNGCGEYGVNKSIYSLLYVINSDYGGYRILTD